MREISKYAISTVPTTAQAGSARAHGGTDEGHHAYSMAIVEKMGESCKAMTPTPSDPEKPITPEFFTLQMDFQIFKGNRMVMIDCSHWLDALFSETEESSYVYKSDLGPEAIHGHYKMYNTNVCGADLSLNPTRGTFFESYKSCKC